MHVTQTEFRAALLDADAPVPSGLLDGAGAPAGRRYAVYRNNVVVSLIEAMKLAFPTVRALLGPNNFDSLVPMYVRLHPPASPLMMHYGVEFPEFLAGFEPLAHLGYLADVARLDLEIRASYHAADALPFDPNTLQATPEVLAQIRLTRAPSTRVLRSRWPLHDLWCRATQPDAPQPRAVGQAVMITRPAFDPAVHLLPTGAATWIDALMTQDVGTAIETATTAAPEFNFATTLTLTLQAQTFCAPQKDPK
ncbi:hypothetical protein GGR95_001179 [Sulfitobacter undariae]|uniref:Putative DNA-binding domain-containing protein n=1 Tax=Sulfitobacter undariae TaxID=1563671 RepID=A0A7W6E2I6_9RHOB|nr:DNA-binding domain-containing protein [Sulfitobacter undariae]MBB3993548.1 hypothetical protein [Sulfitobacter undariae]